MTTDANMHHTAFMARPKGTHNPGVIVMTPEVFDEICKRIADDNTISRVCAMDDMPSKASLYDYINNQNEDERIELRNRLDQARRDSAQSIYNKITEIEGDAETGKISHNVARFLLDSRKWRAAHMDPELFSEKATLKHEGEVPIKVNIVDFSTHKPIKKV